MKYKHVDLLEDTKCPYCATVVPAGASVCSGCNAIFCVKDRVIKMGFLFFIVGLFVGSQLSGGNGGFIAIGIAIVGALLVKQHDENNPMWLRIE
ncbi:MAG: hypothetical protein PHX58_02460 [Desulfovibrio sp.]|nr:hypothetical protein [Desulfovibrio sp.]